jgi:hypothetical protein
MPQLQINENTGCIVNVATAYADMKPMLNVGNEPHELRSLAVWATAVTTWLLANNATECVWLYTPGEIEHPPGTLGHALGDMLYREGLAVVDTVQANGAVSFGDGYLCVSNDIIEWQGQTFKTLVLGEGDSGSSALADYFVIPVAAA